MSHVGKKQIEISEGVTLDLSPDMLIIVTGPLGSLKYKINKGIKINIEDNLVTVSRKDDSKKMRELHGLTRSLLSNMVEGVNVGFTKILDVVGVGYRAQQKGKGVTLSVMLSHTVEMDPLPDTSIEVEGNNRIYIRGADKQSVGQLAAEIRKVRPPNAYTGKGIRYSDEQVRIKPGKSAARE